jgi:hypothetical protein
MALKLANFIGFQIGWFACILAAALGQPVLGVLVALVLLVLHLATQRFRLAELLLLIGIGIFGYSADSMLVLAGVLSFPESAILGTPSTIWMVCLWMLLAGMLHVNLRWMENRWLVGMILGAIAGPLSYYAGHRLGAVQLTEPLWFSGSVIALEWAMAMPMLLWAGRITLPLATKSDADTRTTLPEVVEA